ncbi:phosphatidylglycerophosphatase A family protein [Mucilaginibacter myungsuensis]|uniref:Phosphatidylglycerophosphatase A n=1 Tax=Mucilaginibacter myungsuensis TaxID=649104 RepID=A0A929L199_9SPHI|nr:phosphatidylglycerophosphatase A [Mucilaginibacter myungsuensis]MBE9663758.1 phosphatidylglycerophosphatase A [Mucilaginibacter myungsuensis]MDN3598916.1 phosphatidylglycerophosphatase A [Mucilaginibacter myungsuensis]
MNKLIATWFGIGYIKGGGTIAAAVTCALIWYLWWPTKAGQSHWLFFLLTVLITLLGIYVGDKVERFWGKDSYRVVIDEVSGMMVTMLFVPHNLWLLLAGFILFRFFDMVKPLYIRRLEALPGGTGVMMDDVLAGLYGNIVLQIIIVCFPTILLK